MKKGQVTFFVLLGIVLVAVIVSVVFVGMKVGEIRRGVSLQETQSLNPAVFEAGSRIEQCISGQVDLALRILGLQGGYLLEAEETYEYTGSSVAVLSSPLVKEGVENELSSYLMNVVEGCLDIVTSLEIEAGDIREITVVIQEEDVSISIAWSLLFKGEETRERIRGFDIGKKMRLGKILNDVNFILAEGNEGLCLSCLVEIAERNNYSIEVETGDKDVVSIQDRGSDLSEASDTEALSSPFIFRFAVGERA